MNKLRLWPTLTYFLICVFAWLLYPPPNQEASLAGWIAAIVIMLTSFDVLLIVEVFQDMLDPLHNVRKTPWAPEISTTQLILLAQAINLLLIFLVTSNVLFNKRVKP